MATYYVRPDGNNSNAGTGPAANQAWQTLARIVQAGTAFTSGDTVYIAPGTYRQSITTTATYTSPTYFTGDPTASQFPGVTPGVVRITNFLVNDNTAAATNQSLWTGNTFNYINISNIYFDHATTGYGISYSSTGNNSSIRNCIFSGNANSGGLAGQSPIFLSSVKNITVENCIIMRSYVGMYISTTTDTNTNVNIRNNYVQNCGYFGIWVSNTTGGGVNLTNNLLSYCVAGAIVEGAGNGTSICNVTNNIFYQCSGSLRGGSPTNIIENYNRRVNSGGNTTVPTGAFTITDGAPQFDFGHTSLFGLAVQKPFSSIVGSVNVGAGLPTYASTTDLYGQTWSAGASLPDIGCAAAVQASGTSYYYPTERNASAITVAPGSSSQSIELYLGATGLSSSTLGLQAYYIRNRSNPVAITLVPQTPNGAWLSGGFAEVSSSLTPGLYRLDLPDAAIANGTDSVTVVVRGASGTDGAHIAIDLRNYTYHSTPGYKLISDQLGANGELDIIQGTSTTVKLQIVDTYNTAVPIGAATCTVEVYSSGNLISTYTPTIQYDANGEMTFVLDSVVTTTAGEYKMYVRRNNGGADTTIHGPMIVRVRRR